MRPKTQRVLIAGPAGNLECAIDEPSGTPLGTAIVCHPHPQQGGTMDNKVVQTIAKAVIERGYRAVRFNYRGVGASEGTWDEGRGEVEDACAVLNHQRPIEGRLLLAGFSFGGFVAATVATRLQPQDHLQRMILVGPSTQKESIPPVPATSIVIHGEADDVVPLSSTLDWARPQNLPVIVFPGVGHFFHGQLTLLKSVLIQQLLPDTSQESA